MDWDQISSFITDPRMFTVPVLFMAGALVFLWVRRKFVSWETWDRLITVQVFLLTFVAGIVFGPEALAKMIDAMAKDGLGLGWAAVTTTLYIILATLLLILAFRRLARMRYFAWTGVALAGLVIGNWAHVLVTLGEPFRSMFV